MEDLLFPEIKPDLIDVVPAAAPVSAIAVVEPKALDLAQVDLKDVALAKFEPQRTALETAKKTLTGLVLDLPTQAKIDDAVSLRQRLIKQPIADARATSKALKSKLSQTAKDVTAEEDAIVKALDETAASTITPLIDAAQAVIDAEKEAKRQAEAARIAAHESNLQIIRGYAGEADGKPSGAIRRAIDALLELPLAEAAWEEFHGRAVDARAATVQKLWTLHDQAKQHEDEAARAAAEAERLEAQRTENERIAAENVLVASIQAHAAHVEGDSSGYAQKAITAFETVARALEGDQRQRVVEAIAAGRQQLAARLAAAQERERIAAEQAEKQRLLDEREAAIRRQEEEAEARRLAEESAKRKALQQADLNQSFEAAVIRCSIEHVRLVRDSFLALDPAGRVVPEADLDAYIAALKALQPEQKPESAADAVEAQAAAEAVSHAAGPAAGEAENPAAQMVAPEAAPITQDAQESGFSPADAPACASSEADAAEASPSGDEGPARAENSAPVSAPVNIVAFTPVATEAEGWARIQQEQNTTSGAAPQQASDHPTPEADAAPGGTEGEPDYGAIEAELNDGPAYEVDHDPAEMERISGVRVILAGPEEPDDDEGGIDAFTPPQGFALVPLHPNQEMERVMREEDWQWPDVLAAAGTVTEEDCEAAAAEPAAPAGPPTLKLGVISERWGVTVTETFMDSIGFPAAGRERSARLYHECHWPAMCKALAAHALACASKTTTAA